jgi:hypothetical protein
MKQMPSQTRPSRSEPGRGTARAGVLATALLLAAGVTPAPAGPVRPRLQGPPAQAQPRVNPVAQSFGEIQERVNQYVALHRAIDETLPKLGTQATPEQIQAHQRELARQIQRSQTQAGGAVFTRESRGVIRGVLKALFTGPQGAQLKAIILEESPPRLRVQAYRPYPDNVPLSSMPPQVLAALPKLPPEVEYRFIGRTLILLDIESQLIIDLVENAIP